MECPDWDPGLSQWEAPDWPVPNARETIMARTTATESTLKTSKRDALLKLLRSNSGATIAQMQKATGWQPHSIRGFLSGTVKKRLGLTIQSTQAKNGQRHYQIVGR